MRGARREVTALKAQVRTTTAENDRLHNKLKKWTLFWGWVQAWGKDGTKSWLERLWKHGPPRSRDRGWGGGQ